VSSELLDAALSGDLNLISFEWLLLALSSALILIELVLVVRAEVADQGVEVVELALLFGVPKLFRVHFHRWVDQHNLVQEIRDLLLLPLKLAILLIKVVDNPDRFFIEFICILELSIVGDHRHIE